MELFSHLLIVVSIVLGLGVTELLGGVARILRGELKPAPLHSLWIVIVIQVQLQLAWAIWGLRTREEWRYPEFVLVLLGPVAIYMAATVLFPSGQTSEPLDRHLVRRRRPFFLLNGGYVLLTGLYSWFLYQEGWLPGMTIMRLTIAVVFVTLAVTERRSVQWALGLFILAGHLWFTYVHTFVLAATPARVDTVAPASTLSSADIAAIRTTSNRWMAAMRDRRWDDAAATYTEDAILWIADATYRGRSAIRTLLESLPPFDPTRVLHLDEIRGSGDIAYVVGHSTVTPEGGAPAIVARYLDVRLRQPDGTWLFWRDMVIPAPQKATAAGR
jgi:ketosteroid isomerase-like protein